MAWIFNSKDEVRVVQTNSYKNSSETHGQSTEPKPMPNNKNTAKNWRWMQKRNAENNDKNSNEGCFSKVW